MSTSLMDLAARASALVSARCGTGVRYRVDALLSGPERRNRLVRLAATSHGTGAPETVVLKQADPKSYDRRDAKNFAAQALASDWAGAAFLSSLPNARLVRHGPEFFGGDLTLGMIVLEDLGADQPQRSLVQALLGGDPTYAETGLLAMMTALGRMHADARDHKSAYVKIYDRINPVLRFDPFAAEDWVREGARKLPAQFEELGASLVRGTVEDVEELARDFAFDAPFKTFVHGDPCPDNCRFDAAGYRLFDFEFARLGHAFTDGIYARAPFPSCWCCQRIPAGVVAKMEAAYRRELETGFPEARDERAWKRGLAAGSLDWLLNDMMRIARVTRRDLPWGITSYRARIMIRLETVAATCEEAGVAGRLVASLRGLAEKLRGEWTDLVAMPEYRAFR